MKKFTFNAVRAALLLFTVIFVNFSCTDHLGPETETLPVLITLPITQSRETPPPAETKYLSNYKLRVEETGSVPVVEYGIIYTTYRSDETFIPGYANKLPTIDTAIPHPFTESFGSGEKSHITSGNFPLRTDVFQRAYAKLADGRVIYGDVIWTVAGKVTPM